MTPTKTLYFHGLNLLFSLLAGVILYGWLTADPGLHVIKRLTDEDAEAMARKAAESGKVLIEGYFQAFHDGPATRESGTWTGFRGDRMDNIAAFGGALNASWGNTGPGQLWSVPLGEGHGGAAVYEGLVYMLDYDEERNGDALRCFTLDTGEEIWRRWYEAPTKRNHGRSRTVPSVNQDVIVTMGPRGFVQGVDRATGEFLWGLDLVKDYGTEIPHWYTAQCPLIHDGVAVIAPAGKDIMLMGVDAKSGETIWETPNPMKWKMSHASLILTRFQGKLMYVYQAIGGVVGISAEADDRGTLLWSTGEWRPSVAAPSPIAIDERRLFLTAGYGAGSCMLEIVKDGESWQANVLEVWEKTHFACEQQTPIFWKDHLFSVLPKDAGANRAQFICMDLEGNIVWQSGKEHRYGLGPYILVGGYFFILDDNGMLSMIEASTKAFKLIAEHRVLEGRDAWGPMAFVDGKLLLRDSTLLACLDMTRSQK